MVSYPSPPLFPVPAASDHKRTHRLADPSAGAAPEAVDHEATRHPSAGAAPEAVDPEATRRLFPQAFQGVWPPKKVSQPESDFRGIYPRSYRVLPPEISQSSRDAITPTYGDDVHKQTARMIESEGVVTLSPELLHRIAGDLFPKAQAEGQARFDAQFVDGGEKWQALFHDEVDPKKPKDCRAGDELKTMSKPLNRDSVIIQFLETIAKELLGPEYQIGIGKDGKPHCVLLHHARGALYSGEHYAQEEHVDLHCHGAGNHFSNRTLPACLRPHGPRVIWISLSKDSIALYFHRRSHLVGRMVNQFYVHYFPLWAEYKRTHRRAKEDDFYPIWAVFVEQHVQEQCALLGIDIEPEAVVTRVPPFGGALWHALTSHGGTSEEGLRVFCIVYPKTDQNVVELPETSIEFVGLSRIYAGVMDVIFKPLEVALANTFVAESVATAFSFGLSLRSSTAVQQAVLQRVLDEVVSKSGVRLMPGPNNTPLTLQFKHSQSFLGLVCFIVGRGQGGLRKVVLWLESKPSDPQRGTLFRNAAFTMALLQFQSRRGPEYLKAVSRFLVPRSPVEALASGGFQLLYSPVCMDGEPLGDRVKRDLRQWKASRELTEDLRYSMYGLLKTLDRLLDDGFRLVVVDPNLFYITGDDHVILMFSGGGFLGQRKKAQCDRKQHQGALAFLRRNTSMYTDGFRSTTMKLARFNMRRLNALAAQREAQQADAGPASGDSADDAPELRAWSDSDVRTWLATQKQKPMGVLGRWEAELEDVLVDDNLVQDLKDLSGEDSIMDLLRLTDVHQIIAWLACEIRDAARNSEESFSEKRTMLKVVLDSENMEDAFSSMKNFLHGFSTKKALERNALCCQQPAAFQRLIHFLVFSLHPAYREDAAKELSYMLFVTTAVFNPRDELLLSGEDGIRMEVQLYPFDDAEFKKSVDAMLAKKRKGSTGTDKFPRTFFLKNEVEFGVGVHGPDQYEEGEFMGFYLGTVDVEPHGRHVVTSISMDDKYCNGAANRFLPVSAYLKRGTPGSFMNSSKDRFDDDESPVQPNVWADRINQIQHVHEGRRVTCIPLFVLRQFQNKPVLWNYDPAARHGMA